MKRNVSMEEISDGKLYSSNDLVRADCGGCVGCSECCRNMTDTIILDPYDIFQLEKYLSCTPEALLQKSLELQAVDGMILPRLKSISGKKACVFLDDKGRCSIHEARPGFCRLFPLGRYYENGSFRYFLQTHECAKQNRSKVKIKKWLGIPDLQQYETFIADWHYFLLELQENIENKREAEPEYEQEINTFMLQIFYLTPYNTNENFYDQFYPRLSVFKDYV